MEKSLLTEVKAILKSLVISCPDKITIEQLNRDYRDIEGKFIPFRQLGYGNLEEFLRSIPDTLRVFGSGPTAMVCFVANEKSDHIHDMIMGQKKAKARNRSKSVGRTRNNAFQGNSSHKPKKNGQQLSQYQSVNRNQMARTLQVRPAPQVTKRSNYASIPQKPNGVSISLSNQMLYNLPQPNGILKTPALCTIQNGIIQTINAQLCQNQINHVAGLLNKCNISNPPPPLPRQQYRNISYHSESKSSVQVAAVKNHRESQKEFSNIERSPEKTETTNSMAQIKPPAAKKQVSIKFPEEVVEEMPKLCKVSKPIEPSKSLSVEEPNKSMDIQNSKTNTSIKETESKRFFDDSCDNVEDPDEAIPSFAAKNNVFRMDFPEYTVSYGNKIAPYKLPEEVTVGSCLKIFVTEIHSPFKFWFHIYKEKHEVDVLMYQIERFYSSLNSEDLCIPMVCLTPGQVCAACYNGLWHRAEIVAPPVSKTIKVWFMDYGTVTKVEIENVKFLPTYFAEFPAQALRGSLSHIKPRDFHWSYEATNHFLTLVAELMLYAKVTEIDKAKNVLYMILCDTNGDEVVQVNSSLVENRYAFYNQEWKPERIKHNNGQRLRHPREDFPTFSMIESGEYPSFQELVSLLQRGIDYENIYDRIIFNQSTILNKHESASEGLRNLPYFLTTSNPFRTDILLDLYATTSKVI